MGIKIEHGKPSTLLTAAQMKGEARKQEEMQKIQLDFEYKTALAQQSMSIDLEMDARARMWEIEKAEIASRVDFAREEQTRQRKLDSADNALQQIDKEVLVGRMTEQEARPLKLKYEMNKLGVDVPVSLLPTGDEEDRYGVQPYWMRGREAPEGTPERQLYETKMAEGISGERRGTVPYYLDPTFLRQLPTQTAQDILASRDIIFDSDEDFEAFLNSLEDDKQQQGLQTKSLDVGVRSEGAIEGGRIRVVSPEGRTGTILESELPEYKDRGFEVIGDTTKPAAETVPPTTEDIVKQLEAGKERFRKPSLTNFLTMSPLRALMERRKTKKLVR